jgi:hypothetical protein
MKIILQNYHGWSLNMDTLEKGYNVIPCSVLSPIIAWNNYIAKKHKQEIYHDFDISKENMSMKSKNITPELEGGGARGFAKECHHRD